MHFHWVVPSGQAPVVRRFVRNGNYASKMVCTYRALLNEHHKLDKEYRIFHHHRILNCRYNLHLNLLRPHKH
jgi:hypothetical protein